MFKGKEKYIIGFSIIFVLFSFLFVFGPLRFPSKAYLASNTIPNADNVTKEITANIVVEEKFRCENDSISRLAIIFNKMRDTGSNVVFEIRQDNNVIFSDIVNTNQINDQHRLFINCNINGINNKELTLRIYSYDKLDTGLALMVNNDADARIKFGSSNISGTICFSIE